MSEDILEIEVLEDGTIKTKTPGISAANHSKAERFLQSLADATDGKITREKRKDKPLQHSHSHSHRQHL